MHFAQYCVSVMPDDVRRRILRNRERQAQLTAEDESSDSDHGVATTAFTNNPHIAAAALDLPPEINIDAMDPTIRESVFGAYAVPYPPLNSFIDRPPVPPSPTLTASTSSIAAGTPKKDKKKKKSSVTTNEVQVALNRMSLHEAEEDEYFM